MRFAVAGRLVVALDDALTPSAGAELDPCPPAPDSAPVDIDVVRRAEITLPPAIGLAGDGGDGWISALEGDRLYLVRKGGGTCVVEGRPGELPVRVAADRALPAWALMRGVVRPLLHAGLPLRGAATVHAAAVSRPGAGIVIAGWSESGKTEVALALAERGWSVLADKWTVVDDEGRLAPFPVRAGIRGWVLEYLPRLRSGLPLRARGRMSAAGRLSRGGERLAGRGGSPLSGAALDMTRKVCAQGEKLSMTLSELRAVYGAAPLAAPPVTLVVVLRTVAGGPAQARQLTPAAALSRLHESAAFERRDGLGLLLRRRYAGGADALADAAASERALLESTLKTVPFVEVSCSFPSDPRLIAELVETLV